MLNAPFNNMEVILISFNVVTQIRALEKRNKAGKFAKKVKAKTRRKMHELSNPLEPDEFADMWKDDE